MPRLIVNADDLGYTSGIDRAVLALKSGHALSSATAMANGKRTAAHASSWSAAGVSVGCHVVLIDGAPVSSPAVVPSLLAGGVFRTSLARFVMDLQRGQIAEEEIEREAVAQIRSLQARGLTLTHVDTHKHTHMFPGVLRPLLRAAQQCGISAVRNPYEPPWAVAATRGAPMLRRVQVQLLALGRRGFLKAVQAAGMRTTSGALGVLATGVLAEPALAALLLALARHGAPTETYELVCHPGFADEELARQQTRLQVERQREYAALGSLIPQWCSSVDSAHTLTDFANL